MNSSFSPWKYALIALITMLGFLLALPNIFGKSPTVQIQMSQPQALAQLQHADWQAWGLPTPKRFLQEGSRLELYFEDTDQQIQVKDALKKRFPEASIAVNLSSNAPAWLDAIGLKPMNLGLDLRGGISFLLQVDAQELFQRKSSELMEQVQSALNKEKMAYQSLTAQDQGGALLTFASAEARDEALNVLFRVLGSDIERINQNQGFGVALRYSEEALSALKRRAAEQNRIRLSGRVNSLGVSEPSIQVVGDDRILVQLPGIQDVNQAKELLGSTATLEFYMVDEDADVAQVVRLGRGKINQKLAYFEDGRPIVLKRKVIMSGEHIMDAVAEMGKSGPEVHVVLDSAGGAQMGQITRENIGKSMATVFVEYLPVTRLDAQGKEITVVEKKETVANAATIQGQFSNQFQITGIYPLERAQKLGATLRAGSLVAPVYIIEERTIGPSAGKKNIDQGMNASLFALFLVALFMAIYYRRFGLFANVALAFNLVLLVAMMSFIGATLTLPGIAGIVLTMGMAVDANVLIYERIREERDESLDVASTVRKGFAQALSTIVDANITTLIVAVMLFSFGAGPIKGFAVTLSVGILTTMFSAIFITRALIELFVLRHPQPQLKF